MKSSYRLRFTPENIRMVRRALCMSQPAFAARLGLTRRTIIRWEQGQHLPRYNEKRGHAARERFFRLWRAHKEWIDEHRDD